MSGNGTSWKAISLVLVLFVLGIAVGAVGEHLWYARMNDSHRRPSPVRELKQELGLTTDQAKKFDAIIADDGVKFHELATQERAEWGPKRNALEAQEYTEWEPKRDQVRQQGRDQIRAILTPEQRTKFDAFVNKLDEERRKRQQQEQQQH